MENQVQFDWGWGRNRCLGHRWPGCAKHVPGGKHRTEAGGTYRRVGVGACRRIAGCGQRSER
jgi:hypothetical protein